MNTRVNILISIALLAASAIFLTIYYLTKVEFLLHVAAIPLEILVAVFALDIFLAHREKKERRRQLLHIKSCMFRLEMRSLFIANFQALKSPPITISKIKVASLVELKQMREEANRVEYKSLEAMEPVIHEYVKAQTVWRNFMNIALDYGFDDVFQDMVYLLHFISDVNTFKECSPGKLFAQKASENELLMQKLMKIMGDGIRKYLDFAIELKEKQPYLFNEVISDYELSANIRD